MMKLTVEQLKNCTTNQPIKFIYLLVIVFILSACSHTNYLKSGTYVLLKANPQTKAPLFPIRTILKLDVEKKWVSIEQNNTKKLQLSVDVIDEDRWLADCYTNTSHEVLETWKLTSVQLPYPVYIFAGCLDSREILLTDSLGENIASKSLLFEPIKN